MAKELSSNKHNKSSYCLQPM